MSKRVSTIVLTLLALVAVISAFLLVQYYAESFADQRLYDALSDRKGEAAASQLPDVSDSVPGTTPEGDLDLGTLPQYRELAAANTDMVGWIRIPDTVVDYPVMQTPDSPQYYLGRDFYGEYTSSGSIFMDARCDPVLPQNLILYGHNMKSGTMFGVLSEFQRAEFARQHSEIYFDTLTEERRYEVVACFTTAVTGTSNDRTIYDLVDLVHTVDRELFASTIRGSSGVDVGWTGGAGDQFLTLSTCTGSSDARRLVVVAQRVMD